MMRAASATQRAFYDARTAPLTAHAAHDTFVVQLCYRRGLVLDALRRLEIPAPVGDDLWVYVGGGEGTQCMVLSAWGGRHASLDISLRQLQLGRWLLRDIAPRYIRGLRRVSFAQADGAEALPIRDGSASVAYGLGVLNHLPPTVWKNHIVALASMLRPGGVVFQVVPNLVCEVYRSTQFEEFFRDPESPQYWTQFVTEDAVVEAFRAAGLASIRTARHWHYDHDKDLAWLRLPDAVMDKLAQRLGAAWTYRLTPAIQRLLRSVAESRLAVGRRWRFLTPRHLSVAGVKS